MSLNGDRILALTRLARSRVLPGPEENVGVSIESRMGAVADLIRVGEVGVAFEILSDNLVDYDIRLTESDFEEASAVAVALGIEHGRFVDQLRHLVV